ncbi:MAG: PiT family inorganic phosphate transporter [Verrucomicrobiales bacterium]|jgi:PiT family inorganic phosphate transporter
MEIIANYGWLFIALAVCFGFFMTWGIGANDVANAMGTSVGSGAITVKQAIIIAAIFEFAGAFLAGGNVTDTIRKGIVDPTMFKDQPHLLVFGMLSALLAAAIWLLIATMKGWPVSTTHTIVGALIGFAVAGLGVDSVDWNVVGKIVASWLVSPLLGGTIAFVLMISIRKLILNTEDPFKAAKAWGPFYVFLVGFVVSLVTMFKGLKHLNLELSTPMSFGAAAVLGTLIALAGKVLINRVQKVEGENEEFQFTSVEKVFAPMMIFTACAMAFAHGSNDVANGIGPLAAVVNIVQANGEIASKSGLPLWVLIVGGIGIVVGLATYGYKVMQTIGTKITELTPSRGYCATMAAAVTVVIASKLKLPVSTTHIAVGAVMGVGLARGVGALDLRVLLNIVVSWIITLPAGGLLAIAFFYILKACF